MLSQQTNTTLNGHTCKEVFVYIQSNPNPHALKFVVNKKLIPTGMSFDFPNATSATNAPLASELFTYAFVKRVFYMHNFITVTKKEYTEWIEVQDTLQTHIKNFITSGQSIIDNVVPGQHQENKDTIIIEKIKTAITEHINPAVKQDGGAIAFHAYANGVVTVALQGACKGCPASAHTLKAGVENLLKKVIPDEVIAVEEFI